MDQIKKKSIREVKGEYRFAEWAGLVRECRHSGLNIMTWCEQKGITTNQFYKWQRKVFDALMEQRESQIQGTGLQEPIDGLAALVQRQFELEPFTNTLFLFCGRRRDRLKALYWEKDGFLLLYKRLEVGTELCFFRRPNDIILNGPVRYEQVSFFRLFSLKEALWSLTGNPFPPLCLT